MVSRLADGFRRYPDLLADALGAAALVVLLVTGLAAPSLF